MTENNSVVSAALVVTGREVGDAPERATMSELQGTERPLASGVTVCKRVQDRRGRSQTSRSLCVR
jgi:hypothetical protein